ncbi:MAG: mercuric reductase [Nitrospiraceae bacterium]|jgi:pyruvate/2-oxoglutarate dehydrogenase complex dihydrolipoamide dehydrogenase (E3) component|nr:mercuric reductase [Nitrospiraceae bacterium]MCS6284441.1 mercuric reductase [Nitrospira sp.]OQW67036.1 MAG: mercuric reductase [Nitrospira sp. ST-bin5]
MSAPEKTIPSNVILPDDEHNQRLINHVHPPQWVNPTPTGQYNLVVLGGGTAGLVTAAIAAGLGAKVALIERHLMGGDCLNVGCVPSKALIRASRAWADVRRGAEFGLHLSGEAKEDFPAVMTRMRALRAQLSRTDSAQRFTGLGVDVYLGQAQFTGAQMVQVGGTTLDFAKAVICTGARAAAPPIPGLQDTGYLTNETIFSLTELPAKLAIIGAGPIGCELAQAFARFGSQVYLIEALHGIMPNEDRDAAELVEQAMIRDGVTLFCCGKELTIQKTEAGKRLTGGSHGRAYDITVDDILVGAGRKPNVDGLGLEAAGVGYDKTGVTVDDQLRTTNPNIYAAGDICSRYKFTHAADAMAQIVIQNALFPHPFGLGTARVSSLVIPWATYTDPEIAHVGLYEAEAKEKGHKVETFTHRLDEVDRAVLDGEAEGFAKVHVEAGTDRIFGATIVAAHAGDLINEFTLAMKAGLGLKTLASTIHPYPTQGEVVKKVANAWRKTTFTARQKSILSKWFSWTRK